jgi:hypothetical protein
MATASVNIYCHGFRCVQLNSDVHARFFFKTVEIGIRIIIKQYVVLNILSLLTERDMVQTHK